MLKKGYKVLHKYRGRLYSAMGIYLDEAVDATKRTKKKYINVKRTLRYKLGAVCYEPCKDNHGLYIWIDKQSALNWLRGIDRLVCYEVWYDDKDIKGNILLVSDDNHIRTVKKLKLTRNKVVA